MATTQFVPSVSVTADALQNKRLYLYLVYVALLLEDASDTNQLIVTFKIKIPTGLVFLFFLKLRLEARITF